MTTAVRSQRPAPVLTPVQAIGLLLAIAGFAFPFFVPLPELSAAGHRMLGIFILAIILWISEAIPMHATATLIIILELLLLSEKGPSFLTASLADFRLISYRDIFATLADPVIMLFLGGFFLADGAAKFRLDKNLARIIIKPFGTRPKMVVLGLMIVTAVFSMFMSNTATTATMMTVALPVIAQFDPKDRLRAGIALAIPFAANIGGIGTPIGTPPNAIALGALSAAKAADPTLTYIVPTFLQWTMGAVPFVLVFLAIGWLLLVWLFPTQRSQIALEFAAGDRQGVAPAPTTSAAGQRRPGFDLSRPAIVFYITFAVTVLLWMTESLHGINSNVVGFMPVVVLLSTRVFGVKELKSLDWHVLWLVAGGIALGLGIAQTGMDKWFISRFDWAGMDRLVLVALLTLVALTMGTFISHSATANLLVPIGIALARSPEVAVSPIAAGVFIAIGSSLAMALPISTPPNAIAFATGEIKVKDMAILGALIGIIGWAIFVAVGPMYWRFIGILPPLQ